jgi:hypothetical protein
MLLTISMFGGTGLEAGEIHHLVKSQDYPPEQANPTNSLLAGALARITIQNVDN